MSLKPFNDKDPFDLIADMFRSQVATMALKADDSNYYRSLDTAKRIECFMSGVMTGLVGVCLASTKPEGHDEVMKALADYLPHARLNVEGILNSPQHPSKP